MLSPKFISNGIAFLLKLAIFLFILTIVSSLVSCAPGWQLRAEARKHGGCPLNYVDRR